MAVLCRTQELPERSGRSCKQREELQRTRQGIAGISMPQRRHKRNAFGCNGSAHCLPTTNEGDRFPFVLLLYFYIRFVTLHSKNISCNYSIILYNTTFKILLINNEPIVTDSDTAHF
jgi:hypothetical protein